MGRRFRCGARRCAGKGIRMEKRPVEKIVRIVTLAPVMALLALSILLGAQPERFGGIGNYVMAVIFLTILPLLAYPCLLYTSVKDSLFSPEREIPRKTSPLIRYK